MPRSQNQKLKLLYLMKIMLELTDEQNGLKLSEITDLLAQYGIDSERKSLYSDIESLRNFGIDIEMRKEKDVRYHVVNRTFELPELKLLVDAVQASKFITHRKSNELIKKIESFASKYEASQLQRQVFVTNRIKTMNESIYYAVDYIHNAISKNCKISFKYFEWNEKKEKVPRHNGKLYVISPWGLSWDDENYYMIGYDSESQKIKHYRVDKMLNINPVNEKRDGAELFKNFDVGLYSKRTFGMYGGREEKVTLRCSNSLAGVMVDRFGTDTTFFPVDSEHFELNVSVYTSPPFYTWLMNFGDGVKIMSPDSVKEGFIETAKKALAQYE